jgi:serralysin
MVTTTSVGDTGNVMIDALTWGSKWTSGAVPLTLSIGVQTSGGLQPTATELAAIVSVLKEFERVINVKFNFVGVNAAAHMSFKIVSDPSSNELGRSVPPGEAMPAGGAAVTILRNNYMNPEANLAPGSADYITFMHEFAHAMGLAHPHDAGGGSLQFPGVSQPGHVGYHGLNQGVFTTMSANDGWLTGPNAQTSSAFGLQSGLMALDILALQHLYGANTSWASGNTNYVLPTSNGSGTAFNAIWDTGGVDSISFSGAAGGRIDLRAATGVFQEGGGGYVSSVNGVRGGFTIAKGAVIENATGSSGNDILVGNEANNTLTGGMGDDVLYGQGGKDLLMGGAGRDRFDFNRASHSGPTMLSADVIADFDGTVDVLDLRGVDAMTHLAGNQAFSFKGFVSSFSGAGQVRAAYCLGDTVLYLNTDADMSTESVIVLKGIHLLAADDFML